MPSRVESSSHTEKDNNVYSIKQDKYQTSFHTKHAYQNSFLLIYLIQKKT